MVTCSLCIKTYCNRTIIISFCSTANSSGTYTLRLRTITCSKSTMCSRLCCLTKCKCAGSRCCSFITNCSRVVTSCFRQCADSSCSISRCSCLITNSNHVICTSIITVCSLCIKANRNCCRTSFAWSRLCLCSARTDSNVVTCQSRNISTNSYRIIMLSCCIVTNSYTLSTTRMRVITNNDRITACLFRCCITTTSYIVLIIVSTYSNSTVCISIRFITNSNCLNVSCCIASTKRYCITTSCFVAIT